MTGTPDIGWNITSPDECGKRGYLVAKTVRAAGRRVLAFEQADIGPMKAGSINDTTIRYLFETSIEEHGEQHPLAMMTLLKFCEGHGKLAQVERVGTYIPDRPEAYFHEIQGSVQVVDRDGGTCIVTITDEAIPFEPVVFAPRMAEEVTSQASGLELVTLGRQNARSHQEVAGYIAHDDLVQVLRLDS